MIVNIRQLVNRLNHIPLQNIPSHVELCFDKTGFTFKGKNPEETKELNQKWRHYLVRLNKIAGVEEYLTVAEVAEHLSVSIASVHKIIKEQDKDNPILPYIRTNIGIRIKTSDYLDYLSKCYEPNSAFSVQNRENLDE